MTMGCTILRYWFVKRFSYSMRVIQAPRASAILYNVLVGQKEKRPWLLPANICPIVPITFFKAGVPFEFVDISAETLHMDLKQVEVQIKKRRIGGVLFAHTYGKADTPHPFFEFAKSLDPELIIVDDRCLCVPDFEGSPFADVTLYSTGYAKMVDLGFGGYAFINNEILYKPARLMFNEHHHAQVEDAYKKSIQNRSRYTYRDCDWLDTSESLPEWNEYRRQVEDNLHTSIVHREQLNQIYASTLPLEIQLPQGFQMWRFNIRVENKPRMLEAIFDAGLFASSHYVPLTGIMANGNAPEADRLAGEVINLFNDHHFDTQKAGRVCEVILNHYDG